MMYKEQIDTGLLKKYFSGVCNQEEKAEVEGWFRDPKYEKSLKYKLLGHWKELDVSGEPDIDGKKLLDRIYHQIYKDEWRVERRSFLHRVYHKFSKAAAILLIPLLTLAVLYIFKNNKEPGYAEVYSPLGTRTHFVLPDGSKGWLNSGSTLKFPVKFTGRTRKVMLSGEGYFDVVKNPRKPFIVNTANMNVIALGTKFDVLNYPTDRKISIVLESGKVAINEVMVGNKQKRITELNPGQKVSISKSGGAYYKQNVMTSKYVSWREGILMFRNDSMPEVVEKINRWYNVHMIIKDKEIESYRYRATFKDETLDEVLKMLKITSPIDYYIPMRNVKLDGTVCHKEIYLFLKKNRAKYVAMIKSQKSQKN